jgi:His/Glu/Gln/Arg/opine family amino acid ABC transporter permease subunit
MMALPIDFALASNSMPALLKGMWTTMALTAIVLVLGLALSIPISLARMSPRRIYSWPAAAFVITFRGAPLLILLYLVYYGFAQSTWLREGPLWFVFSSAFACAVIGLTLNHTAFMVEVVRGSLMAVPAGLVEASASLGLTPRETFVWIRLPLALRYGLKAYQNEVIMFTKGTAVVSVITVTDLTAVAHEIFEITYDPFTPILTAALLYWLLINAMRIGFDALERHLNRHNRPVAATGVAARAAPSKHAAPTLHPGAELRPAGISRTAKDGNP